MGTRMLNQPESELVIYIVPTPSILGRLPHVSAGPCWGQE